VTRLLLSDAAKAVDARKARSRQKSLGPSSVGVCRRQAGYDFHNTTPSNPENQSGMAAIAGTWFHAGALDVMRREWGAFIEVTVQDGPIKGHVDAVYLPQPALDALGIEAPAVVDVPTVDDLKTKGDRRMVDHMRSVGPSRAQLFQTHLYADLLRRGKVKATRKLVDKMLAAAGPIEIERVQLRYVARAGDDEEYLYEQAYDQSITDEAWQWIGQVTDSAAPEDLPRDQDGPGLAVACDYCPFVTECWGEPIGDLPVQTQLIVEDEDLTAALGEYHRGLELTREGNALKDKAKAMVTGSDAAVYHHGGEAFKLGWSGGRRSAAKPDVDAIIALLDDAGLDVPMIAGGRSSRSISVVPYDPPEATCGHSVLADLRSVEDVEKSNAKAVKADPDAEIEDPGEPLGECIAKEKHSGKHAILHPTSDPL